jgi:hypothetical protein
MTEPVDPTLTEPPGPARLNAGRLWAGGVATAIVAALVVVAGVYIARSILGIPVLAPRAAGSLGSSTTAVYAAVAAAGALLATGLLHVLLLETPQPVTFFVWITALADVIVVAAPFGQPAPLASKVFTAVINLVVGVAVISLLTGVARSAVRPRPVPTVRSPDMQPR